MLYIAHSILLWSGFETEKARADGALVAELVKKDHHFCREEVV